MRIAATALALLFCLQAEAAPIDEAIRPIQDEWAEIKYRLPAKEQQARYEKLAAKAREISTTHQGRAEALIWEGIVVSSLAGAQGGLGALSRVKEARSRFDEALTIDPAALQGSAHASLGVLYHKVPGWPLAFGDKAKAEEHLRRALALNPAGIDPNFFLGEFLLDQERYAEARRHLELALKAAPRAGRELADSGRREEIRSLLEKLPKTMAAGQ